MPPAPIRALRDLTRTRTVITRERTREVQRLEKLLEDAGIKLSAVATDITGASGRAMLEALIKGQRDPAVLAELAQRRLRSKIPALIEALRGRFNDHHAFMARLFLDRIDAHTADIGRLDERIEEAMKPFHAARDLLISIPGFSRIVADVFIAETGADMSVFPSAAHLSSWAGVSPGSNESAGRVKSTTTRPGNTPGRPLWSPNFRVSDRLQGRRDWPEDLAVVGGQGRHDDAAASAPRDVGGAWRVGLEVDLRGVGSLHARTALLAGEPNACHSFVWTGGDAAHRRIHCGGDLADAVHLHHLWGRQREAARGRRPRLGAC